MRLKLSGPDYRDQDPVLALEDFKKRISLYEKAYMPLGNYEETHDIPYIQVSVTSLPSPLSRYFFFFFFFFFNDACV
jgi:hypothetical protein